MQGRRGGLDKYKLEEVEDEDGHLSVLHSYGVPARDCVLLKTRTSLGRCLDTLPTPAAAAAAVVVVVVVIVVVVVVAFVVVVVIVVARIRQTYRKAITLNGTWGSEGERADGRKEASMTTTTTGEENEKQRVRRRCVQ